MKNNEKKVYAAPKVEVLAVELEQGIASASTNTPAIDNSFDQGTGSTGWGDDASGF